jgi:4-amino-4-deoxy-L-arabinose transferase-like glycosyltransferase
VGAKALLIVLLLALALRLLSAGVVGFSTVRFGDARAYLSAAETIAREGRYPIQTDVFFFRPPGYPAFLTAATLGHPEKIALSKIATASVGSLAAPLLALLSARLFRRRSVAIATGLLAAVHPAFLLTSSDVQSEPLFLALLLGAGYLLLAAVDRPSTTLSLAAGGIAALAALTRSSALALVPFLLAPLLDRRYPRRARAHLAGAAVVGFLFVLAPWTIRNALVFGEFIPVNDAAGNAFYQGNSDWTLRFYDLRSREEYDRWVKAFNADMRRRSEEMRRAGQESPTARSRAFAAQALAERRRDHAEWAKLLFLKGWDWLRPYPHPIFWRRGIVFGVAGGYVLLFSSAAIGLARAPRPGVRLFVLAFLAVTMIAHVLIIVVWRYRVPYWDPVLVLYGTFGAGTLLTGWKLSTRPAQ